MTHEKNQLFLKTVMTNKNLF